MKRIFVPTQSGGDWQRLLAKPGLHWKKGKSAMTAAACWEAGNGSLPADIAKTLNSSPDPVLADLELLLAVPEWKVPLVGGVTSSHTDIFALTRNQYGLVALAVEAKVDEAFGPTLEEKRDGASSGQKHRLDYLHSVLRINPPLDDSIRYQLLHRTASAVLIAKDFHAHVAVMLVQSFSPTSRWRDDFDAFCAAVGAVDLNEHIRFVPDFNNPRLFLVWCPGDQRFRDVELPSVV